jgi:hypothetical protein
MTAITAERREAIARAGRELVQLTGPETNRTDYLVAEELFDRLRRMVDDAPNLREVGILADQVMREDDAGDPLLDSYQRYAR